MLVLTVALLAALAGCASSNNSGNPPATSTPTETTATTTTPTATTTPTVSTPSAGLATTVTVLSAPVRVAANGNATVCWKVDGTGHVPHTAVHYDTTSHTGATVTFSDYKGGAMYPGNKSAVDPAGYDLPGTFCTNVPVGTQTVYFRAHVIDSTGAPGRLSDEMAVKIAGTATGIYVTSAPTTAAASSNALVCWHVNGTGNIAHTAVHYDTTSHAGSGVTFADYKGGAMYPGNQTAVAPAGYDLPGDFCTNVPMPPSGTLYYRAHYIDSAGVPGTLTDEKSITVG
jgi:hypothetical protein